MSDSEDKALAEALLRACTSIKTPHENQAITEPSSREWLELLPISYYSVSPDPQYGPHRSFRRSRLSDNAPGLWPSKSDHAEYCDRVDYSMVVVDTDWDTWLDDEKIRDPAVGEQFAESIEEQLSSSSPALLDAMLKILEHPQAHSLLAGVAAQRVRAVVINSDDFRERTWQALHRRLDNWIQSTDPALKSYALSALPSAIQVGRTRAVSAVAEWIQFGSPEVARSAAMGFLTGTARAGCMANHLSADDVDRLYRSVKSRLSESDDVELCATLVWALGPIATKATLPEISETLAMVFVRGHGREDASAVRVGKMLTRSWRTLAYKQLKASFIDEEKCDMYLTLVCLLP